MHHKQIIEVMSDWDLFIIVQMAQGYLPTLSVNIILNRRYI